MVSSLLPPSETAASPVVLLRWTTKGRQDATVRGLVEKEVSKHGLTVVRIPPNTTKTNAPSKEKPPVAADDALLLLAASREVLELQAETDRLIKPRIVDGLEGSTEVVMDHFSRKHRGQFETKKRKATKTTTNESASGDDGDGKNDEDNDEELFSAYERCHLVLNLLDDIAVSDESDLLKLLLGGGETKTGTGDRLLRRRTDDTTSRNLCYLLQHHGWIDVLTPLHDDALKLNIWKAVCFPLRKTAPPVDAIARYYGPGVAYYFAFVGFLLRWLAGLGVLGLSTFLLRVYRGDTIDEDEVCVIACGFGCYSESHCDPSAYKSTDFAADLTFRSLSYLCHQYTPFYGLVCFLWAVLLYRFWEQEEYELAYRWGTLEMMDPNAVEDPVSRDNELYAADHHHRRPEFRGTTRKSPVTGQPELYFSPYRRKLQYLVSGLVTSVLLAVAFFVMILSLNLQGYIRPSSHFRHHPFYFPRFAVLSEEGAWFDAASDWNSLLPVVLHAVCIFGLNTLYRRIASKLTDWENHESHTQHDNSLVLKRFLFEAFDCYIALFYLAFYERDVDRLRSELVAIFNIDSFRRLGTEVILPGLLHLRNHPRGGSDDADSVDGGGAHRHHSRHDLHLDAYEPFDDYMEVLIQFGYVVLFASAYPLASLFMAGALWFEMRVDAYKLTHFTQKPATLPGERTRDIGVWKQILAVTIWCSCLTNCLLFGYTSDQMMHYLPDFYIRDGAGVTHMVHDRGWIAILIIFGLERILIVTGLSLHTLIPTIPEGLVLRLRRRRFLLARQSKKAD